MPYKLVKHKFRLSDQEVSEIKNLIFDFGGVIIDVDYQLTINAFKKLGFVNFDEIFTEIKRTSLFDLLETGKIPEQTFRNELRKFKNQLSDSQIDHAWNAMIGKIPAENMKLLRNLRKNYRTFLLSNTNIIHIEFVYEYFKKSLGQNPFEDMFEQIYLSYEIGLRKPSREAYQYVLDAAGLKASETLFIDDLVTNVQGAENAGLFAHHLQNETLAELFEPSEE